MQGSLIFYKMQSLQEKAPLLLFAYFLLLTYDCYFYITH
jgi:hypothetical protein